MILLKPVERVGVVPRGRVDNIGVRFQPHSYPNPKSENVSKIFSSFGNTSLMLAKKNIEGLQSGSEFDLP